MVLAVTALLGATVLATPAPRTSDSSPTLAAAQGRFLVARHGMADPRFARTVVLIVEHGVEGSLGLIVNRRTRLSLDSAFDGAPNDRHLWLGGPVSTERASLLLRGDDDAPPVAARRVLPGVFMSTSGGLIREVLEERPADPGYRVYAGYSGWGPSQLEAELSRGDWHVREASVEQIFGEDGDALWQQLIPRRGNWVQARPSASVARLSVRR